MTAAEKNLAREGGDRGFSAGAGDRDDCLALPSEKFCGRKRDGEASVCDFDEGRAGDVGRAFGDDRRRALGERFGGVLEPIVLDAAEREKRSPGFALRLSEQRPAISSLANAGS